MADTEALTPWLQAWVESSSRDDPRGGEPVSTEEKLLRAIAVDPDTARLLATLDVRLHLPLTDEAKADCLALADDPQPAEPRASGWLGRMLADSGAVLGRAPV